MRIELKFVPDLLGRKLSRRVFVFFTPVPTAVVRFFDATFYGAFFSRIFLETTLILR